MSSSEIRGVADEQAIHRGVCNGGGSHDDGGRCRGGRPLLSGRGYNSNYQIFQGTDYVGIQIEMHHETLLIPIGEAAPSEVGTPSVMGSSPGYWDGDTLVVETTNLSRGVDGSTPDVQVTERIFLRPSPGTGAIYEYACHEGNYAAELSLVSTRRKRRGTP